MRMYKKDYEDDEKVIYRYLNEDYKRKYTGIIEMNKKTGEAKMIKPAYGEWKPKLAAYIVPRYIAPEGFPDEFTHNAV